jgi:hypothetical protein
MYTEEVKNIVKRKKIAAHWKLHSQKLEMLLTQPPGYCIHVNPIYTSGTLEFDWKGCSVVFRNTPK